MDLKLPKNNSDYKAILKDYWGVDIDKDELIGKYSPSKNGTQGFFSNCTTIDNKPLSYPDDKFPLRILIWANPLKLLKPEGKYKFKVQFAALDKRIQLNPFLLVTQRDCVIALDSKNGLEKSQPSNGSEESNNSSSLDSVINDIYNEKLLQNNPYNVIDIAEAVEALAIDIYSENKRFIYELIQNADDAAIVDQSELLIEVKSGFVILSHNGKPFDERDLRGLCGIGRGTKRDDEAKTGYKGIGFKSVFGQQDGLVFVKTNDLLFRFDRNHILQYGWNPRWGIQKNWEKTNQTKFKSPWQLIPILSDSTNNADVDLILNSEEFTVKTAIKIKDESALARDINELFSDARFLLFLRKIHKVTLVHGNHKLCIKKESDDDIPGILSLHKNDNNISNWYLRTGSYLIPPHIKKELQEDIKSPKKLQEMIRAELSFAFKLEADLKSISLLPSNESCIFTYLPTSVSEFGFPFLVNSNFLVDAGREKLHQDRIWNQWLFEIIGEELIKCCAEFATIPDYKNDYLKILLDKFYPEIHPLKPLKERFNKGMKVGIEKVAFILNYNDQLVKISDIIIDEVELLNKNLIPIQFITQFINSNSNMVRIAEQNILQVFPGSEKLKHFGAKTLSQSDLKKFLQSAPFLSNHQIICNYNLLKYLKQLDTNDFSGEWNYIIRNNTFIYSNENTLEKIPLVCFPVTTFVTEFGSENKLIEQELYNSFSDDSDIIDWLKLFGVKAPSEIAYLEKEIIGKIDSCINDENFRDVTEFILKLHAAKEIGEEHYNELRDLPLKSNSGWAKAKDCFLPAAYNPAIDFSSNINGLTTVSAEYIGRYNAYEWKTLFVAIDVADDINILTNYKIQNTDDEFGGPFFTAAVAYGKEGHSYPNLVNTNLPQNYPGYITYFSFLTKTTQFKFSAIFWERLISKYSLSIEPNVTMYNSHGPNREAWVYKLNSTVLKSIDLMRWGHYESNRVCIPSYIFWHLKSKQCIPTNKKTCLLASDVFTNTDKIVELGGEYIPIIQVPQVLSNEWIQLIGLKSKLTLADLLNILSSINNDINEKGFFKRDNIRRVGLLYNEIINGINELTIQEEKEIKDWANKSKFLCNDYVSRKNSEVIWLRIEGFNEYNDKIPSILIPKNVNVDDKVEKLFSLFGISIVDKCDYKVQEEKEDVKLSIKILEFLPALSLILLSRMKIKDEEDYLKKAFKSVENFKFYICQEILLILNYGDIEIKGSSVKYYLSDERFYFTNNWQNPLDRFNISHYLASFLKCNGLEQEIQLLLELSDYQVNEYLESVGLSLEMVKSLPIYFSIQEKVISLKESIRPSNSSQSNSSGQFGGSDEEDNSTNENCQDAGQKKDKEESEYDFLSEVEKFIESMREVEDIYDSDKIEDLKSILAEFKNHPKEKQLTFNLLAKLKLCKKLSLNYDRNWSFNSIESGDNKYLIHSARGSFAYIHPNEILKMKDEGYKMAIDFGTQDIRIYNSHSEIISLYQNYLMLYQGNPSEEDILSICENSISKEKFHFLIADREKQVGEGLAIFKFLNNDTYD